MKYTVWQGEKYYPILIEGDLCVFYKNLCFTFAPSGNIRVLYSDFGPPEYTEPTLPEGFRELLSEVAGENQGDLITAMLTVCAGRNFPPEEYEARSEWVRSVDKMIASLSQEKYHYSEAGFYEAGEGTASAVSLTDIIETHCTESEHQFKQEEPTMAEVNPTEILSMEELLKMADEPPAEEAPIPELAAAPAEEMQMSDAAVDAVVAEMLGSIPDEEPPAPIIPDIPLAEPVAEEAPAPEPVPEPEPIPEPVIEEAPAPEPEPEPEPVAEPIIEEAPAPEPEPVPEPEPIPEPVIEEAPEPEPVPEPEPIPEPVIEESPVPEPVPVAAQVPAPIYKPLLKPMNESSAHRVLCVRVDADEVGLAIPGNYPLMISDNTLIFPENGSLITRDFLTGSQEATPLNESVLAAFSYSIEHFASENESYTGKSLLFEWFFKSLLKLQEAPDTSQKINDYFSFIGCPIKCTGSGFTDESGTALTVAEVFEQLSAIKA